MEENVSVYKVYLTNGTTREGRAEILRAWGPGFEQEGAGGGRAGQLNLCVDACYDRGAPLYF